MNKFENQLLCWGLIGNKKEKRICSLGNIVLINVKRMNPGSSQEERAELNKYKNKFSNKIRHYSGEFSDYFSSILEEINFEERLSLGYGIHSD